MGFFHKKIKKTYDKENLIPVIHASICTGEQIFGFKNKHTNEFIEVEFVPSQEKLLQILKMYDISLEDVKKEY